MSRMVLQATARKLGYDPLVARDGAEAWTLLQAHEVDVVISDWMMPNMDGLELCRNVRATRKDTYTYFVLLTALANDEHLLMGLEAGADEYLTKPLNRDELGMRLLSASRVTSLHRQLAEHKRELERLNRELYAQARTDPLTQLGNRLHLNEDLEAVRARVERYGHRYTIGLCDIDYFKRYNDTYGHQAGDEVLRRVAGTMRQQARTGDEAYRYGGEEFLVLLTEQPPPSATLALNRMREAIRDLAIPHRSGNAAGIVTISAGVASFTPEEPKSVDELLREADIALYRAKEAGRDTVETFAPAMSGSVA